MPTVTWKLLSLAENRDNKHRSVATLLKSKTIVARLRVFCRVYPPIGEYSKPKTFMYLSD
jgi:hypothetical protein